MIGTCVYVSIKICNNPQHYLVGGFNPLKNISQLGLLFPIYGKIKKMFQTTNQLWYNGWWRVTLFYYVLLTSRTGKMIHGEVHHLTKSWMVVTSDATWNSTSQCYKSAHSWLVLTHPNCVRKLESSADCTAKAKNKQKKIAESPIPIHSHCFKHVFHITMQNFGVQYIIVDQISK